MFLTAYIVLGIDIAPSSPKLGLAELKMVADITQKLIMQGRLNQMLCHVTEWCTCNYIGFCLPWQDIVLVHGFCVSCVLSVLVCAFCLPWYIHCIYMYVHCVSVYGVVLYIFPVMICVLYCVVVCLFSSVSGAICLAPILLLCCSVLSRPHIW